MAYKHKGNKGEAPKLDMTPMIDVVFQLLIFFVVALKQEDILSMLSVACPTHGNKGGGPVIPATEVVVDSQGFVFGGKQMRLAELDRQLGRISAISKTPTIVVKCTKDSPHGMLVQALDLCSKHGLTNVAIFSL